jgi:hypothetical protein
MRNKRGEQTLKLYKKSTAQRKQYTNLQQIKKFDYHLLNIKKKRILNIIQ